jgi:hypothetical protein
LTDRAEDFVNGFYEQLMQPEVIATFDPRRGNFRTWLAVRAGSYAANQARKARSEPVSLDPNSPEKPTRPVDPDTVIWAKVIVARALDRTHARWARRRRAPAFDAFWPVLFELERDLARVAQDLRISMDHLHTWKSRLGKLWDAELRAVVGLTLGSGGTPAEREERISAEIRRLLESLLDHDEDGWRGLIGQSLDDDGGSEND